MQTFNYNGEDIEFDGTMMDLFNQIMGDDYEMPAEFENEINDAVVLDAFMEVSNEDYAIEDMDSLRKMNERCNQSYLGEFGSWTDFAYNEFETACSEPDAWYAQFIDFDKMGESLKGDYEESNGHFFNLNAMG